MATRLAKAPTSLNGIIQEVYTSSSSSEDSIELPAPSGSLPANIANPGQDVDPPVRLKVQTGSQTSILLKMISVANFTCRANPVSAISFSNLTEAGVKVVYT